MWEIDDNQQFVQLIQNQTYGGFSFPCSILYTRGRYKDKNPEKVRQHLKDCHRIRNLVDKPKKYKRGDKCCGNTAQVVMDDKQAWRSKVNINGTDYEFLPGEPINDVCFSPDTTKLYILYQNNKVLILDV